MKIKLAILEKDKSYLQKIAYAFNAKYADKLEIYCFTDQNAAMETINSKPIDVFVASELFDIDFLKIPNRCGFAYLAETSDIESINEKKTIGKFQRIDLIYRCILDIYSEGNTKRSFAKSSTGNASIIVFEGVSGGCGCSSMAAACALHFAEKGKRTIYVNLEKLGSSDVFFSAEGQYNMGNVVFELESKRSNLSLKLESFVKRDSRGVYFFSESEVALDIMEMGNDNIILLLNELNMSGMYDVIIVDIDFDITAERLKVLRMADELVWVGDGSEISNKKIRRGFSSLSILEEKENNPITGRLSLIYNKFSKYTSKRINDMEINILDGIPRFEHADTEKVINELSKNEVFNKLLQE